MMYSSNGKIDVGNVAALLAMGGREVELCDRVVAPADPVRGIPERTTWKCRTVTGYVFESSLQRYAIAQGQSQEQGNLTLYLSAADFEPTAIGPNTAVRVGGREYRAVENQHICQRQPAATPLVYIYTLSEWRGDTGDRPRI